MISGAEFSLDRVYRYALWRTWGYSPSRLVVIGLNPSTADETKDDPTIRRCIGFAKREGCDGLIMLNVFAFRATDPRVMAKALDPIGSENDATILRHADGDCTKIVAAWGTIAARLRTDYIRELLDRRLRKLYHFGLTKDGYPRHPLYLRGDTPLTEWPYVKA